MKPKQIKINGGKIHFEWSEGIKRSFDLKYFREECPCANCKGETILYTTFKPQKITIEKPEMYKIAAIAPVGDYAIQIRWKDGHDTGIYSWTYIDMLEDQKSEEK
ncbi:MAG: DUF971 domain-containing protein [Ignavibacteriales bacterium]|jgi:DUF971 family protein|nr:DUF971 domain-containing protein [Ignavibacteriales bacterium]MBK8662445.1 DUF971 domain-containing protein [Ignavibacteriales bacterium]